MKRFAGGLCLHWTIDNQTHVTRVTLDFRIIVGSLFHGVTSSTGNPYNTNNYYMSCRKDPVTGTWEREGPLIKPNARMGFPWTVKDWDKFWANQ